MTFYDELIFNCYEQRTMYYEKGPKKSKFQVRIWEICIRRKNETRDMLTYKW